MSLKNSLEKMAHRVQLHSHISIRSSSSSSSDALLSHNYSIKSNPYQNRFVKWTELEKRYCRMSDHEIYLSILYRSMTYVRKFKERSITDDGIMLQQLQNHIAISTYPTPLNTVGEYLLRNGYVLTALSLLMSRIKKQKIYFGYLMAMFDNTHDIISHKQEFNFYLDMGLHYVDSQFNEQ